MTIINNISTNTAIFLTAAVIAILLYLALLYLRNPVLVKLGLRNIPRRPTQSILIIVGLALSTIIIVSALSTGDTLSSSLRRQAVAAYGEIDEILAPPLLSLFISLADQDPGLAGTDEGISESDPVVSQNQQQFDNLTTGGLTTVLTVLDGGLPGITEERYMQLRDEAAADPLIDRVAASILFPTIIRNTTTGQGEPLGFIFAVDNDYDESFGLTTVEGEAVEMETLQSGVGNIFGTAANLFGAAGDLAQRAGLNLQLSDVAVATAAVGAALTGAGDVAGLGDASVDLAEVRIPLDTIDQLAPFREFIYEARFRDRVTEARLVGVYPEFAEINNLQIAQGRFIAATDLSERSNICVIGSELASKLFQYQSVIGQSIFIADRFRFRVIGVIAPKMASAGIGSSLAAQDYNKDIYIPSTTDRARIGDLLIERSEGTFSAEKLELSQLTVRVKEPSQVKSTAAAIESLLASTHEKEDYAITIPLDLLEQRKAVQRIFNFVLGSIAAISLLVGGIGIMNIMLATVSERTREIGIRRALGATQTDITVQFLVETLVLSASGAFIGAAVGLVTPPLISYFTGRETAITFWGPMAAVLVALLTGLIFGIYPARRAASLDPIEALRSV